MEKTGPVGAFDFHLSLSVAIKRLNGFAAAALLVSDPSPLLHSKDEQVVEEEQVDGVELGLHVEQSPPFRHLLHLPLLLQKSSLRDDGNGLESPETRGTNIYHVCVQTK